MKRLANAAFLAPVTLLMGVETSSQMSVVEGSTQTGQAPFLEELNQVFARRLSMRQGGPGRIHPPESVKSQVPSPTEDTPTTSTEELPPPKQPGKLNPALVNKIRNSVTFRPPGTPPFRSPLQPSQIAQPHEWKWKQKAAEAEALPPPPPANVSRDKNGVPLPPPPPPPFGIEGPPPPLAPGGFKGHPPDQQCLSPLPQPPIQAAQGTQDGGGFPSPTYDDADDLPPPPSPMELANLSEDIPPPPPPPMGHGVDVQPPGCPTLLGGPPPAANTDPSKCGKSAGTLISDPAGKSNSSYDLQYTPPPAPLAVPQTDDPYQRSTATHEAVQSAMRRPTLPSASASPNPHWQAAAFSGSPLHSGNLHQTSYAAASTSPHGAGMRYPADATNYISNHVQHQASNGPYQPQEVHKPQGQYHPNGVPSQLSNAVQAAYPSSQVSQRTPYQNNTMPYQDTPHQHNNASHQSNGGHYQQTQMSNQATPVCSASRQVPCQPNSLPKAQDQMLNQTGRMPCPTNLPYKKDETANKDNGVPHEKKGPLSVDNLPYMRSSTKIPSSEHLDGVPQQINNMTSVSNEMPGDDRSTHHGTGQAERPNGMAGQTAETRNANVIPGTQQCVGDVSTSRTSSRNNENSNINYCPNGRESHGSANRRSMVKSPPEGETRAEKAAGVHSAARRPRYPPPPPPAAPETKFIRPCPSLVQGNLRAPYSGAAPPAGIPPCSDAYQHAPQNGRGHPGGPEYDGDAPVSISRTDRQNSDTPGTSPHGAMQQEMGRRLSASSNYIDNQGDLTNGRRLSNGVGSRSNSREDRRSSVTQSQPSVQPQPVGQPQQRRTSLAQLFTGIRADAGSRQEGSHHSEPQSLTIGRARSQSGDRRDSHSLSHSPRNSNGTTSNAAAQPQHPPIPTLHHAGGRGTPVQGAEPIAGFSSGNGIQDTRIKDASSVKQSSETYIAARTRYPLASSEGYPGLPTNVEEGAYECIPNPLHVPLRLDPVSGDLLLIRGIYINHQIRYATDKFGRWWDCSTQQLLLPGQIEELVERENPHEVYTAQQRIPVEKLDGIPEEITRLQDYKETVTQHAARLVLPDGLSDKEKLVALSYAGHIPVVLHQVMDYEYLLWMTPAHLLPTEKSVTLFPWAIKTPGELSRLTLQEQREFVYAAVEKDCVGILRIPGFPM